MAITTASPRPEAPARAACPGPVRTAQRAAFEYFPMTDEIAQRAVEVQGLLAQRAQHRSVSIPDLLIAATAERYALTVLHYDGDYDRIAAVSGQATEWVVPPGTAH